MTKKILQKLVLFSYINGALDKKRVEKIISFLNRKELKRYIRALKLEEKKKTVFVSSPFPIAEKDKKTIENKFPEKKINYIIEPSLIVGIKIIDNDLIYNLNLRNILENMVSYVSKKV